MSNSVSRNLTRHTPFRSSNWRDERSIEQQTSTTENPSDIFEGFEVDVEKGRKEQGH